MAAENLNDIPFELKPLAPFLQRAQELKVKDPTMSYWCTYYAVQQGVHLKPREKTSRNFLMKLMLPLESIRNDPSTKVTTSNEAASIYIEDFALRVFDAADNEDRRGDASRGTAKKFLAAANFLELLKVFEESNPSQPSLSNDIADLGAASAFSQHKDKIRYAKWKAGDIAKAFREGRRPVPGPANAPESMRRGAMSPAGVDPQFGNGPVPGNSPSQAAFPFDIMPSNGLPSQFSRPSSSKSSSNVVSPVPGGSRNASMSPKNREGTLTNANGADYGVGMPNGRGSAFSPINGLSNLNPIKTNGTPNSAAQPLIREPAISPTSASFGPSQGRGHSQSFTYEPARPSVPAPPKDYLSVQTPSKPYSSNSSPSDIQPSRSHLYATPPIKNGASPGGWSTAATPGGYDDLLKRNGEQPTSAPNFGEQASPSRKPEGLDVEPSSYPPRPYPPTPALPLKALRPHGSEADSDDENWSTAPDGLVSRQASFMDLPGNGMSRQDSLASNAATAGGNGMMSRQGNFVGPADRRGSYQTGAADLGSRANGGKLATIQDEAPKTGKKGQSAGSGHETDELAPLPTAGSQKKVRWTPSVVGGSSTVASSSPPSSPRSPLGELPALPESSDSSSNGDIKFATDVRFTVNGVSPPTSADELPSKVPPRNPYAESPWPGRTALPQMGKTSPPPQTQSPSLPVVFPPGSSQSTSTSSQSTPTVTPTLTPLPTGAPALPPVVRRSPLPTPGAKLPFDQPPSAKASPLPTPTSSGFRGANAGSQPPAPPSSGPIAFPTAGPGSANGPPGPPTVAPTRHRRASSTSATTEPIVPMSALHPRPFVPRFTSNDSSPSGSTIVSSTSTLGRPRNGISPQASPPQKQVSPPPSSAPAPRPLPTSLDFNAMNAAKRHSKFAASALEFEDLETARRELMAALAILNGERFN